MNKEDITKEQLITLWEKSCKCISMYSFFKDEGSTQEPAGSIIVSHSTDKPEENITLRISSFVSGKVGTSNEAKFSFNIQIIFDGFLDYGTFRLSKEEFDELSEQFNIGQSRVLAQKKNDTIERQVPILDILFKDV